MYAHRLEVSFIKTKLRPFFAGNKYIRTQRKLGDTETEELATAATKQNKKNCNLN